MKLTQPQRDLLDEIREKGGLYIAQPGRYHRTIVALARRGLVRIDEHDWSASGMDHWIAIDVGEEAEL
jgi:hypothetical protein